MDENPVRQELATRRIRQTIRRCAGPITLMADSSTSMTHRSLLSTAGALLQGTVRFLTSVFVGRIGGPAILGAYSTALSTAQLIVLFGPTSIGSASSKFVARARGSRNPEEASAVAAHLAKRALQSGLCLTVLSAVVWVSIDHAGATEALAVSSLVMGLCGYSFTRGLLYGSGHVVRATGWDAVTAVVGIGGVILALLAGYRGLVILFPLSAAYLTYSLIGWPWGARGPLNRTLRREVDGFIMLGIVGTIASAGFLSLSIIVVRLTVGVESAGQYAAALALATPPSLFAASFSLVLFPTMSEAWGRADIAGLKRQTSAVLTLMIIVMVALFGSLILTSGLTVQVVWGTEFTSASTILPVLLVAVMMITIGVPCTNALTSRSQRGMVTSALSSLVGMAVGALSWLVLAPMAGAIGVALGYLLGALLIMVIPVILVWRRDGHQWAGLTRKAIGGVALVLAVLTLENRVEAALVWQPLYALIFLLAWAALMSRTLSETLTNLRVFRVPRPGRATERGE